MSNPIFNTGAFPDQFNEQKRERRRFYMNSDSGTVSEDRRQDKTYAQQHGMPKGQAESLERSYGMQDAAGSEGAPMTFDDVIRKTAISFVVVLLGAGITVTLGGSVEAPNFGVLSTLLLVGIFGGLALGIVNAVKREPNPGLILAYSLLQGFVVGAFSMILEAQYPGIVLQAVLATVSVFAAILILFKSGKVRATPKLNKIFMVAVLGYFIFSMVNFGMMLFGATDAMFGLRTGWLGVAIGLLGIALATYSLVLDFTNIDEGVRAGVHQKYGWTAAFGLTVSLVWLYIEILRLLAILRGMQD